MIITWSAVKQLNSVCPDLWCPVLFSDLLYKLFPIFNFIRILGVLGALSPHPFPTWAMTPVQIVCSLPWRRYFHRCLIFFAINYFFIVYIVCLGYFATIWNTFSKSKISSSWIYLLLKSNWWRRRIHFYARKQNKSDLQFLLLRLTFDFWQQINPWRWLNILQIVLR